MHLSEYLKSSLAKQKNNFLLVSEGGSGKTTSLLHSCKFFHSNECLCNGKRVIPIYIHLVNCDPNDRYTVRRQLVVSCSYIDDPAADLVGTFAKFKDEIFDNVACGFMFLVMLDAINEVGRGENMNREISELAKLKNVCVILSSRYKLSDFDEWKLVRLNSLDDSIVREEAGEEVSMTTLELLRNPFYLSRYHSLKNNNAHGDLGSDINAHSLLQAYYKWLTDRQAIQNSASDPLKNAPGSYSEQQKAICESLLPMLCFEMCRSKSMLIDLGKTEAKKWSENGCDIGEHCDVAKKLVFEYDIKTLLDAFCVPIGIVLRSDGVYRISHEIYRDFLAAEYISGLIKRHIPLPCESFKCSLDVIRMLACVIISEPDLVGDGGEVYLSEERFEQVFFPTVEDVYSGAVNACFLTYNLLERFNNGTRAKVEFCRNYVNISRNLYEKIALTKADENIIECIRIHAEILRRAGIYDEAIAAAEYFYEQCSKFKDAEELGRYRNISEHMKVKCMLYAVHDIAKKGDADKDGLFKEFSAAVKKLNELSDSGYVLSRNLYAMLLAYPDALSEKYMAKICEETSGITDIKARREQAFYINLESAKKEYKTDRSGSYYHYPLQQCAVSLINGEVSCTGPRNLEHTEIGFLLLGDSLTFDSYSAEFDELSFALAKKILEHLRDRSYDRVLDRRYAEMLIIMGNERKEDELMPYLKRSEEQLMSKFIISLLRKDNAPDTPYLIKSELIKSAKSRTLDSFDAVYVREELGKMWEIFGGGAEYNNEYISAVEEMLSCELREVDHEL